MPLTTKVIKQKIGSTRNIKKITKTMEMISVSKMKKAVEKDLSSRDFSLNALRILVNLSVNKEVKHPLMKEGSSNKKMIVLITSNKGLCGGYHVNLFKVLSKYFERNQKENYDIYSVTVGKYAEKMCKKLAIKPFAGFINFSENSSLKQIRELSDLICKEYVEGNYKSAKILYTEFINSTNYKPVLRKIFPVSVDSIKNILDEDDQKEINNIKGHNYLFEPNAFDILDSVLPGLVGAVVYQTLAESFASEHSSRMFAMKNAGDNADSILNSLILSYNNARQAGVTRELAEIVSGADALSVD